MCTFRHDSLASYHSNMVDNEGYLRRLDLYHDYSTGRSQSD
ncbi:MAG: hypothetical protein ACPHYD_01580 [Porticoccaceae bacterium]